MTERREEPWKGRAGPYWRDISVGEVASVVFDGPFGSHLKSDDYSDVGRHVVRLENIGWLKFVADKRTFVSEEKFAALRRHTLLEGDVLVSSFLADNVRVCRLPAGLSGRAINKADCFCVRVDPDVCSSRFLMYRLACRSTFVALRGAIHGATRPRINLKQLRAYRFKLPPLAEQKRIADKLDALLARVDACREHLDRVPTILKRFRQSVLGAAMHGELTAEWRESNPALTDALELAAGLGGAHERAGGHRVGNAAPPTEGVHDLTGEMFPSVWMMTTLRELVRPDKPITYGILKPGPELAEGVSYVRVADFPDECLNLATIRRTSRAMDEAFKRSRLAEGDMLLSIRGTVGRLIVIPRELTGANITQDSARLSIQHEVNSSFVLWYLRSEFAQRRMRGSVKGVAVRGINIGDVRALQIPLPSRPEQDEIVRRIETLLSLADRVAANHDAAVRRAAGLTPTLLAKAFRGELAPQESGDAPAAALLERLRGARKAGTEAGRRSDAPASRETKRTGES